MFAVLRVLLVLWLLGSVWAGYHYLRSREAHWLRRLRVLFLGLLGVVLIIFVGLLIQRLLEI